MCNFLSAIITPKGDILWHPLLDSHTDLVRLFKLQDDKVGRFAKVELIPGEHLLDPAKWKWRVDEEVRPKWLDEVERTAETRLRAIATAMILNKRDVDLLVDGCHIIGGGITVNEIRGGRILAVCDGAKIDSVYGSAKINRVCDEAKINSVYGSAKIDSVYGSAKIDSVYGSAKIDRVYGSAKIDRVCGSAKINSVCGSAKIDRVCGSAKIDRVYGSAKIDSVCDEAKINKDARIK